MSLRLRLALWYGGLTGVLVLLVCVYAYAVHSRAQYDQLDATLLNGAEHIALDLAAAQSPGERAETLAASLLLGAGAGVYGADGALLESNVAAEAGFDPRSLLQATDAARPYSTLVALVPSRHDALVRGAGRYGMLRNARGERWRVYVLRLGGTNRYLAATMSLRRIDDEVVHFGRLTGAMAVVGSIVALLLGWLLARHALRPVTALSATVGAIAHSGGISRRVRDAGRRDEVGQLATTFNLLLANVERASEAQRRFLAAAAHELRAPLTVVRANLELLQRTPPMSAPEQSQALAEAHAESTRMSRLIADLLSLARADAGVPLRRLPVELDRVLLDVMSEVRHLARGTRLQVADFEQAIVQGDPDHLKQLILILLDNATKYSARGGEVTVSLRHAEGSVIIDVRDTGDGIAPEDLAQVFERFYRANVARSRDRGGTGLGLPIARWIAEEHGGTVELRSVPGRGTTAIVRLPIGAPAP